MASDVWVVVGYGCLECGNDDGEIYGVFTDEAEARKIEAEQSSSTQWGILLFKARIDGGPGDLLAARSHQKRSGLPDAP